MTDVERQHRAGLEPTGLRLENVNLLMGGAALVLGTLIGLVSLDEFTAFAGGGVRTVADIAALSSGVLVALAFLGVLMVFRGRILPWHRTMHPLRQALNLVGLTLMMGSLTLFAVRAFGRVAASAFIGLRLDQWSGTAFIALTCALCVYTAAGVAGRLNTELLSGLVSIFLVLGAFMSAVNASDQEWWRVHFSSLGMAGDFSGFAFNYTLVLTGLVIVTLADFLTHDLRGWLRATGQGVWKAYVLRAGLGIMGVMLAGVGLIPVTLSHRGHLWVTYATVLAFIMLAVAAPVILRRIPWGFRIVSFATLGFMWLLWYLHRDIRYLNTTGFEMIAVATVLGWMVLFIRTVVAADRDVDSAAAEPAPEDAEARAPVAGELLEDDAGWDLA